MNPKCAECSKKDKCSNGVIAYKNGKLGFCAYQMQYDMAKEAMHENAESNSD